LLQCICPLLAQSVLSEMSAYLSDFWGKADMGRRTVPIISAASDPKRTLRELKSRSAAVEAWYHPSIA